jgi:hypothetical protein
MGAPFFAALGKIGAFLASKHAVATLIRIILLNVVMGALQRSLRKRPAANIPPINVTTRNPIEERRIIFGEVRAGGAVAFR